MPDWNWIVPLIGGGAAGACITAFVTWYRGRVQAVGFTVDHRAIFSKVPEAAGLPMSARVTDKDGEHSFDTLYLTEIVLQNKGNKDFDKFEFDVTTADTDKIIHVAVEPPDVSHSAAIAALPSPANPLSGLRVTFEGFNRADTRMCSSFTSRFPRKRKVQTA